MHTLFDKADPSLLSSTDPTPKVALTAGDHTIASRVPPIVADNSPTADQLAAENPVPPYGCPDKRRWKGFGARSTARSSTHDRPSPYYLLHNAWAFLDPHSRRAVMTALPVMTDYARLRYDACVHRQTIIEALKAPRLAPDLEPPLCPFRARFMGAALISFNLDYGDLVRWLDGEYTNDHRNWSDLGAQIEEVKTYAQRPGYPVIDHDLALEACTQGVPLAGHFTCKFDDVVERLDYDNHSPLKEAEAEARVKFGKEEANSYHIAFPRWMALFLYGLFISPISWVVRKGKGRIIIDASTRLKPGDTGSANDNIPKAGTEGNERENPPVHYGTATQRIFETIWNLRLDHPREDILQHGDDIDAAFRRLLYHPDLAIAFAAIFCEFLMIPVGMIFGARNSPSWWCIPAELRAHMAATLDYSSRGRIPLADKVELIPPPTDAERANFVQAVPDDVHQGTPPEYKERQHHIMFVDDNLCIDIRPRISSAIRAAVASAYDCFGHPDNDRRGSCLQAAKFPPVASFAVTHLGYVIDTRSMRVSWPADKCDTLLQLVVDWLHNRTPRTPAEIAKLLGLLRHGAYLCPLGEFLSIRLQLVLSAAIRIAGISATTNKRWWGLKKIPIPAYVYTGDLTMLAKSLQSSAMSEHSIWSRPIALLVRRAWTCQILSDAAYTGIGGWSPTFKFMWRITRADLVKAGFNMKAIDAEGEAARTSTEDDGLHINPLEFVGIILNIWFVIAYLKLDPYKAGGHIVAVFADNTSALSWFRYASRSHRPAVRNLAFLCQCLIIFSQTSDYANFQEKHIRGKLNNEADALSRPELFPTMACAINQFSQLQTCRAFLLPFGLLSTIGRAISSPEIGEQFVSETMSLLTLEPTITPIGADGMPSQSGFFKRSHRGRRSR